MLSFSCLKTVWWKILEPAMEGVVPIEVQVYFWKAGASEVTHV